MLIAALSYKKKIANDLFMKSELLENMVYPYNEYYMAIKNKIDMYIYT